MAKPDRIGNIITRVDVSWAYFVNALAEMIKIAKQGQSESVKQNQTAIKILSGMQIEEKKEGYAEIAKERLAG